MPSKKALKGKRTQVTVEELITLLEMVGDPDMLVDFNGEPVMFVERKNSKVNLQGDVE